MLINFFSFIGAEVHLQNQVWGVALYPPKLQQCQRKDLAVSFLSIRALGPNSTDVPKVIWAWAEPDQTPGKWPYLQVAALGGQKARWYARGRLIRA